MTVPMHHRRPDSQVVRHDSRQLERLRTLARVLDSAIRVPGTPYRFGLDPLIGLVPGIGDAIGAIFSTFIILHAARVGAPKTTLARMMANVAIDTFVGEIPLFGDLFDFGWKSNTKNLALLEEHLQQPAMAGAASRRVLLLLVVGMLALAAGAIAIGVIIASFVLNHLR